MEEPRVRKKRPKRGTRLRKWILLLFMGFGLFCVTQALNLYLRISMETKNQHILQERDTLTQQRDTLKQKLQDLESLTSEGWLYFKDSWYRGSTKKRSWNESRKFCQEEGADLIIINSVQEQELARMFRGHRWIGLSDLEQEGVWRWVDGSLVNISFWFSGQPNKREFNEHCVSAYDDSLNNWHDYPCSRKYYCICEK